MWRTLQWHKVKKVACAQYWIFIQYYDVPEISVSARGKVQSKTNIFLPFVDLQCYTQMVDLQEKSLPHYLAIVETLYMTEKVQTGNKTTKPTKKRVHRNAAHRPPEKLVRKSVPHVVLGVDNRSVVHAWQNKSVKGNITASALVRALMVVSAYLECQVYVVHVKRNTTTPSYLADCLTRDTTAPDAWPPAYNAVSKAPLSDLWAWLENPTTDWQLGFRLVDNIKKNL